MCLLRRKSPSWLLNSSSLGEDWPKADSLASDKMGVGLEESVREKGIQLYLAVCLDEK